MPEAKDWQEFGASYTCWNCEYLNKLSKCKLGAFLVKNPKQHSCKYHPDEKVERAGQ